MSMRTKRIKAILIVLPVFILVAGFSYRTDTFFLIKKNFTLFSEVINEVSNRYVDDIDPEKVIRHGINSMLELLDPYTVLIDEADNQSFEILTTGRYAGVGIEVGSRNGRLVVIAPIEGYSAHQKGVRAGDVIIEVDGISTRNMSIEDLESLISGEPGTLVVLMIERFGIEQPILFELIRENVEIRNINYFGFIDDKRTVGYISLARFGQNASVEVREALSSLKSEGTLQHVVLDLRNNPGGLLDEAVKIVDKFVGPGVEVVKTRGRSIESTFTSRTSEPVLFGGRVVVLINNGSASAAEIVAGALQDLDRAVVIGQRSFGKGLVQIVRPLSYNTSLKITTSRYYIPSGRSIQSAIYSHEEAGVISQLPDSLRNMFRTRSGRMVFDGIGIEPDIEIKDVPQSLAEIALLQNSAYFFYANEYRSNNAVFDKGYISDQILNDFYSYLERTSFDYTTRSERYLASLEEQLQYELSGYNGDGLESVRQLVTHQKKSELMAASGTIKRELLLEIIARYEGPTGRIAASLKTDPVVSKAVEILNGSRYESILAGGH